MGATQNVGSVLAPNLILPTMITVEDTTIVPKSSPVSVKFAILGDIWAKDEELSIPELKALVGANSLLYCLIKNESSWRVDISGDSGKAYGLLQFHQPTFDMFSKRYGLDLDRNNPVDQILLAKLMLNENLEKNIKHWTVWPLCYKIK